MRELREILERLRALRTGEAPGAEGAAIATIVAVEGSSYRREGARMLIEPGGRTTGVLSGGCVEREIGTVATEVGASREPRVVVYDLTGENEAIWGFGLGCEGRVTLLVEPVLGPGGDALERALGAAIEDRRYARVATVFASPANEAAIGEKLFGFEAEDECQRQGKDSIEGKDPAWWRGVAGELLREIAPGSARSARLTSPAGSFVDFLLESVAPPIRLVVLGAERDVVPLARLGGEMGWDVVVVSSRELPAAATRFLGLGRFLVAAPRELRSALSLDSRTAVVVASHRYLDDLAVLGEISQMPELGSLRYLGLLGPERRRARLLSDLEKHELGLDPGLVRGPAGLALGGRAPEEVALAIVAEIQAAFAHGAGGPLTRASAGFASELVAAGSGSSSSSPRSR